MDLKRELERMRVSYTKKRPKDIKLRRPDWLTDDDDLSVIYSEKKDLLAEGRVYYATIVQANNLLFQRRYAKYNCPADILYTTAASANAQPLQLRSIASKLFSYKERDLNTVPEEWREIARHITDEHERSAYVFTVGGSEGPMEMHLLPIMIFRELLPGKTLTGSLLPVLALPDKCRSVLVLPEKYWSKEFKNAWKKGQI